MKVSSSKFIASNIYKNSPSFRSTNHTYINKNGLEIGNDSCLFREDLDWKELADYQTRHFKNKDKINVIQFASSDGSEAYTQIMTMEKHVPEHSRKKFFPIKAYDINKDIVDTANSKLFNIIQSDYQRAKEHNIDITDYFKHSDTWCKTTKDMQMNMNYADLMEEAPETFQVSKKLTEKVKFHQGDMYKVLKETSDNSDSIVMCRNILGYFTNDEVKKFINIVKEKLHQNSLFVIGSFDTMNTNIENILSENGFVKVFKNVFKRV